MQKNKGKKNLLKNPLAMKKTALDRILRYKRTALKDECLYHSTKKAKARTHSVEWPTDNSVQKQWSMVYDKFNENHISLRLGLANLCIVLEYLVLY